MTSRHDSFDRERLRALLADRGRSARSVSIASGLGDTVVRDILNGKSRDPGAATLAAIARALGVPFNTLIGRDYDATHYEATRMDHAYTGLAEDGAPYVPDRPVPAPPSNVTRLADARMAKAAAAGPQLAVLPVLGRIQAGAWLAVDSHAQTPPKHHTSARDPRYPHAEQWLSEVVGDSMNLRGIVEGDLVHMVDLVGSGWYPKTGDIVEVERTRFQGRERELTLKEVEVTGPQTMLLWPRSTNPAYNGPIEMTGPEATKDDVEVRIRGKMINLVRRYE